MLGADGDALWLATVGGAVRWRVSGPGVVTHVVAGDYGHGAHLYVARGVGRGFLAAPLVLQALDLATGAATELARLDGERNEAAHLSIDDVDRDGRPELAFAFYDSKYTVRTRHLEADGAVRDGAPVRMASSRAYGDLDGDGKIDEVVGRVYGDAKGEPGDLKVDLGAGFVWVPVEQGVRALLVARLGDDVGPTLYVADGWVANYGKDARATLKRVRFAAGKPVVEAVGRSPDDFTFFALTAADVDGDGAPEIVAQGSKQVSVFSPGPVLPWARRAVVPTEPVLNTAVARGPGGVVALVPGRPVTRTYPLK